MNNQVKAIRNLFKITKETDLLTQYIEESLAKDSPIALYKCAETLSILEWIFDRDYIVEVVGEEALQSMLEECSGDFLPLLIFKKVGPMSVMFVDKDIIREALLDLKEGRLT